MEGRLFSCAQFADVPQAREPPLHIQAAVVLLEHEAICRSLSGLLTGVKVSGGASNPVRSVRSVVATRVCNRVQTTLGLCSYYRLRRPSSGNARAADSVGSA